MLIEPAHAGIGIPARTDRPCGVRTSLARSNTSMAEKTDPSSDGRAQQIEYKKINRFTKAAAPSLPALELFFRLV